MYSNLFYHSAPFTFKFDEKSSFLAVLKLFTGKSVVASFMHNPAFSNPKTSRYF